MNNDHMTMMAMLTMMIMVMMMVAVRTKNPKIMDTCVHAGLLAAG